MGPRTAASCTTSFMSYSMPTKPRMSALGGVLPQRWAHARCGEGQMLAVVDALDESGQPKTPAVKQAVRPQSTGEESLPSKGKFGTVVDPPLRRSHVAPDAKLDRATALAAVGTFSKLRLHAAGIIWTVFSTTAAAKYPSEWWKSSTATSKPPSKGPWLQESQPFVAEGPTHRGHQDRIHRSSESSLKCAPLRILVLSRKNQDHLIFRF